MSASVQNTPLSDFGAERGGCLHRYKIPLCQTLVLRGVGVHSEFYGVTVIQSRCRQYLWL